MNALNDSSSSCWNSEGQEDTSAAHTFRVDFGRTVQVARLGIEFQAGFVAKTCQVEAFVKDEWIVVVEEVDLEDIHEMQTVPMDDDEAAVECTALRLTLQDFTDFYGRITIYKLEVWGNEVS